MNGGGIAKPGWIIEVRAAQHGASEFLDEITGLIGAFGGGDDRHLFSLVASEFACGCLERFLPINFGEGPVSPDEWRGQAVRVCDEPQAEPSLGTETALVHRVLLVTTHADNFPLLET